ncbi:DNA-binding MarR family transcriptional regulator [Stackebrandtia albiflava]|uniref:DNA-binding MarR family transcriptional regulator n=1 Tax=Stackebrandtia albiflava TaxID=406432 RepID=A0A562VDM5_9ACTN|nr:helix-turn-helix domain-containing protein [Stackebrandtia albiflava]TWJ15958.1 DNA-binding MarR family transcriptional regulator [Stackebrandtia albiflava]
MSEQRAPEPAEITAVLGFLPLIATYFDKARGQMPPEQAESFAAHGLTARHGAVCVQLLARPAVSVGELAEAMGLALSTVSELVGDLDAADWVDRRPDPGDRRRTLVSLAAHRVDHMRYYVTVRAAPLLAAMDRLTPQQREGFAAGIRAWAEQLRHWRP